MTVKKIFDFFNLTDSVKDLSRSCRSATVTNEKNQLNLSLSIVEDSHNSDRELHQQDKLSIGSIHNILKNKLKFQLFKVTFLH